MRRPLLPTILITSGMTGVISAAVEGSFGALRQPQDDMLVTSFDWQVGFEPEKTGAMHGNSR